MSSKEIKINQIAQAITLAKTIAICGHVMPDGDSLGSELAMGIALRKMGKEVLLFSPDPVPESYSFLPAVSEVKHQHEDNNKKFDIFISVDCSVPDRLGSFTELMQQSEQVVIIDHHAGSTVFGDLYLNDPEAAAAGEIIFDILKVLPVDIDSYIAQCLYVAIVTDTGSFRYDNTGPETHLKVAELLRVGIPAARINKQLFEEKPLVSLKILEEALGTLMLSECGRIAWMCVSRETLKKLDALDEHVDGIINYPRMIKGVELALFYREVDHDTFKISFRSKYNLDVNKLAALFGGGGHSRAAGCIIEGDFESVHKKVLKAAMQSLEDAKK
ncbi:DHH family phosphoesterase [Desulfotruncus alcoholivorax]|uniref:DHH family phosphoesterase n=1 Tax=Desulfotruncus alcoholivorax TaxID=265477 RepID=UPI0003FEF750|nr:bifunctional oligoribonuclease/PAP phosphatase NrnA [Desulfotruncus alcoholivorax]